MSAIVEHILHLSTDADDFGFIELLSRKCSMQSISDNNILWNSMTTNYEFPEASASEITENTINKSPAIVKVQIRDYFSNTNCTKY